MSDKTEHIMFDPTDIPCYEISDPAVLSKTPLVSIKMITYNHESYISQAIKGVIDQDVDFPIELVIGEDCSTDRTRQIVMEYQKKHPDLIRILTSDKNVGAHQNGRRTEWACRGKYIAFCEGDDYWIDQHKLQSQVDYLESRSDYSICFHKVKILKNGRIRKDYLTKVPSEITTAVDLAKNGNYIHTCSCLVRNTPDYIKLPQDIQPADYALHLINTKDGGKIGYIKKVMAIYRIHSGGIWSLRDRKNKVKKELDFYAKMMEYLPDYIAVLLASRFLVAFSRYYITLENSLEKDDITTFALATLPHLDKQILMSIPPIIEDMESTKHIMHVLKRKLSLQRR